MRRGGILADDMGLGKTLIVLGESLLLHGPSAYDSVVVSLVLPDSVTTLLLRFLSMASHDRCLPLLTLGMTTSHVSAAWNSAYVCSNALAGDCAQCNQSAGCEASPCAHGEHQQSSAHVADSASPYPSTCAPGAASEDVLETRSLLLATALIATNRPGMELPPVRVESVQQGSAAAADGSPAAADGACEPDGNAAEPPAKRRKVHTHLSLFDAALLPEVASPPAYRKRVKKRQPQPIFTLFHHIFFSACIRSALRCQQQVLSMTSVSVQKESGLIRSQLQRSR